MTNHVLNLRLLAHPLTGGLNLSDSERLQLVEAAKRIEELEALAVDIIAMVSKHGIMAS